MEIDYGLVFPGIMPYTSELMVAQKGEYANKATAFCDDPSDVVLGGSCTSFPGDNTDFVDEMACDTTRDKSACTTGTWPWMILSSYPEADNENMEKPFTHWNCVAGQDWGTYVADRSPTSQVICGKSKVDLFFGSVSL